MNLLGSLNFARLIKTFLPGFIMVMSLYVVLDSIYILSNPDKNQFWYLLNKPIALTLIIVPLSIVLGTLCNTFVFTFLNERFVRTPFKNEMPELTTALAKAEEQVRNTIVLKELEATHNQDFIQHVDLKSYFMERGSLENIVYIQESYWYYIEFIQNSVIASFFAMPASMLAVISFYRKSDCGWLYSIMWIVVLLALSFLIYRYVMRPAVRQNYRRHVKKEISWMLGTIAKHNTFNE